LALDTLARNTIERPSTVRKPIAIGIHDAGSGVGVIEHPMLLSIPAPWQDVFACTALDASRSTVDVVALMLVKFSFILYSNADLCLWFGLSNQGSIQLHSNLYAN
jgi:hypothetical protein